MTDLLIRSSLLLALIWCAAAGVGWTGGSAAMRHMVWLLGLGGLLLLPLVSALLPPLQLAILPAAPQPELVAAAASVSVPAIAPVDPVGWGGLIELFYLIVAAALLGRLALGHYVLARLWRRARPATGAGWPELLGGLKSALGIRRPVALRIAAGASMPMTWGTLTPRILLPAEAAGWTDERRRIVLLHELAHIARHDSFSRWAGAITCALYWFHPAIWYAARRMRLEQEHACDDLVLAQGARPTAYARDLLEIAGTLEPAPLAAALSVAMARSAQLEQRLTAIIRGGPRRRSPAGFVAGSGAAAIMATWLIATAAPVAAVGLAPAPTPTPSMTPPVTPTPPATPVTPVTARAPRPPIPPVAARPRAMPLASVPPVDYDAALAQYRGDLDDYHRRLADYRADLAVYYRQVEDLRSQGNLANSGNSGNTGNSGNSGNPGQPDRHIPPVLPTPPTPPTPPTAPTPLNATSQGP